MKSYFLIFFITFLAEMGDKTQVSTLLFSSDKAINRWGVLVSASCALAIATLMAVIIGSELDRFVSPKTIKLISGLGFIGIGIWSLLTVSN